MKPAGQNGDATKQIVLSKSKVSDAASRDLINWSCECGVETVWDRFEATQPQCGFGTSASAARSATWARAASTRSARGPGGRLRRDRRTRSPRATWRAMPPSAPPPTPTTAATSPTRCCWPPRARPPTTRSRPERSCACRRGVRHRGGRQGRGGDRRARWPRRCWPTSAARTGKLRLVAAPRRASKRSGASWASRRAASTATIVRDHCTRTHMGVDNDPDTCCRAR